MKKVLNTEWLVEENAQFDELVIEEGGKLLAPTGKAVTLLYNGISVDPVPGRYLGAVELVVSAKHTLPPDNPFMRGIPHDIRPMIAIEDGILSESKAIPQLVHGGSAKITAEEISDVIIYGRDNELNGIIVTGDSEVKINNAYIEFEHDNADFHTNDFIGVGAGIAAYDTAKVYIDNTKVLLHSVTRCGLHVGGHSEVWASNSQFINESPATTQMNPNWCIGCNGTNRTNQLCEYGTAHYDNCYIKSNGWGALSIDGNECNDLYLTDCVVEVLGPRAHGYGSFCIGDARVINDHTTYRVQGYPVLFHTEDGVGLTTFENGCDVWSSYTAVLTFRDDHGTIRCADSKFNTGDGVFLFKGSNTFLEVSNCEMNSEKGLIVGVYDCDDPGMDMLNFKPPVGLKDSYVEGRDLTSADEMLDIFCTFSDCRLEGDFFNGTTALYPHKLGDKNPRQMPDFADRVANRSEGDELLGPKNLVLNFKNCLIKGMMGSAVTAYREGVTQIDSDNRLELDFVSYASAETVNNGVIVSLDRATCWTVTGRCWLTKLEIAAGATVKAPSGKTLTATVDGKAVELVPGTYTGKIVLDIE